MVRTTGTAIRTSGSKSSKSRALSGGNSCSVGSPTSRRGTGGNKLVQRPIPQWQKPINNFINDYRKTKVSQAAKEESEACAVKVESIDLPPPTDDITIKQEDKENIKHVVLLPPRKMQITSSKPSTSKSPVRNAHVVMEQEAEKWSYIPVSSLGARFTPDFSLLEQFENDNAKGTKRKTHVNYIS